MKNIPTTHRQDANLKALIREMLSMRIPPRSLDILVELVAVFLDYHAGAKMQGKEIFERPTASIARDLDITDMHLLSISIATVVRGYRFKAGDDLNEVPVFECIRKGGKNPDGSHFVTQYALNKEYACLLDLKMPEAIESPL